MTFYLPWSRERQTSSLTKTGAFPLPKVTCTALPKSSAGEFCSGATLTSSPRARYIIAKSSGETGARGNLAALTRTFRSTQPSSRESTYQSDCWAYAGSATMVRMKNSKRIISRLPFAFEAFCLLPKDAVTQPQLKKLIQTISFYISTMI
jgi:hypothetical protein